MDLELVSPHFAFYDAAPKRFKVMVLAIAAEMVSEVTAL
jgi:hypothetical protein